MSDEQPTVPGNIHITGGDAGDITTKNIHITDGENTAAEIAEKIGIHVTEGDPLAASADSGAVTTENIHITSEPAKPAI
ncbi:hypothetical protein [Streptomyces sp. NPDC051921]|uniref:hypothetical protein n=1 Tax=Streptomyces sp. NPDC051921 TaxID=3155806 RepID=UPI003425FFA4